MNFEKPSQNSIVDAAVLAGGAVGGAAISRGVFGAIPLTPPASGTDYKKIGARLALMAIGIAGAASLSGSDSVATGVKGVFTGVAIQQGLDLVADFAAANTKTAALATSNKASSKFAARALGLNCPCDNNVYALNRPRKRALRAVDTSAFVSNLDFRPALNATNGIQLE